MGVYYPNQSQALPGHLIQDFGTVTTNVISADVKVNCYQVLRPGWYWFAVVQQNAPANLRVLSSSMAFPEIMHPTATLTTQNVTGVYQANVSGALPANTGTLTFSTANEVPRVHIRLRSAPFL
jgi:hypothetical protein